MSNTGAILPQHYTASQPSEDGGGKILRNVSILPHRYTASQHNEDGGTEVVRNVGILPQLTITTTNTIWKVVQAVNHQDQHHQTTYSNKMLLVANH
jgi:hypothetical protein